MRFVADAGISPRTVDFLTQLGHEAVHVRTLGMQRAPDPDIIERARSDSSIVLTFDLDFGEVLALACWTSRASSSFVWPTKGLNP
jgi:predicted nuclease of predicted toxin-antitoxin system